jgi:DNA repair exonuclease SbcCD ATPase subunit
MRLKSISYKNIGCFGNKVQTVIYGDEGGMTLLAAKNGSGKTTFLNLPKLLFYGKIEKIKKTEIANRINQNGWMLGVVETAPGVLVTIERKFAPSDLIVYKNTSGDGTRGEDIGKAGISNYQDYIDNEVIGLPYSIYSNIISLSVNDFKSLMTMTPNDKRIIIDKLFNTEILNKMNELIKKDSRDIKINMDLFDREIVSMKRNIESSVKELERLKERIDKNKTVKVGDITSKLTDYKPKLEEGYAKLEQFNNAKNDIIKSNTLFLQQKAKITHDMTHINSQLKLFAQDMCPTCATPFTDTRFDIIKEKLNDDIVEKKEELEKLKITEHKFNQTLTQLNAGITKINDFIIKLRSACNSLESELKKLNLEKPEELQSIQRLISQNSTRLSSRQDEKMKYDTDYKYLAILEQLYSDSGIKKRILENYIPTINLEIEYALNELHFPYRLNFTNDFEPELRHLGYEISVDTLSTGEKKRVDIAILISIMRMLKRKYPQLNLFMLDEILSSIDADGRFDFCQILFKLSKELKLNIFIVDHSVLPSEYFTQRIDIFKDNGFSDYTIESFVD